MNENDSIQQPARRRPRPPKRWKFSTAEIKRAENAVARLIDCLEGIASENGYDYLERFVHRAEWLIEEEAKDARQLLCQLAEGQ